MTGRPSLLRRLLGISLAVTLLAVAGTAFEAAVIANHSVPRPPDQAHVRSIVYGKLLAYAATNRSWRGVTPLVAALARGNDVRIQLSDLHHHILAGARPPGIATAALLPVSVLDPLNVNGGLSAPDCGKPARDLTSCGDADLLQGQLTRRRGALAQVAAITTPCLRARKLPVVTLRRNDSFTPPAGATAPQMADIRACVTGARSAVLTPYVTSPAVLSIGGSLTHTELSAEDVLSIIAVAAGIVLLAGLVTVLAGQRVVEPLRSLARAVHADSVSGADVAVARTSREVAELADAFYRNQQTRRDLEEQRRASISDTAHELRTPLSNIRAWLEARRDGLADDPGLDTQLLEEARTLQSVVDDLQLISLAESGQLHLSIEPFDLVELLEQVRSGHGATAGAAITIDVDAPHPLPVDADRLRLRRVLDNLMTNAIRAVQDSGGGRIRIIGRTADTQAVVSINDSGGGIADDDIPHVFDRFWRPDGSRTRTSGGSGLGLAIVRELVIAHHGDVSVDSSPAEGTTFRVCLPAHTTRENR